MWLLLSAALAADWPIAQATEPGPDPAPIRPWGFVQAVGEGVIGGRPLPTVTGEALAAYEGQLPLFNRVGPGEATWGFTLRRARLGLRGAIPKTDGRISYLLAAEAGDNGLTRTSPVVLTDASVTVSYIPGVRLRAGQFKLPLGEEALESNPIAADFVNLSNPTSQLLQESPVVDGAYAAGASGFRDIGVQAFNTFTTPVGELSYALMLSNGRMGAFETDNRKDLTHRLGWTWVWGDHHALDRDEVGVYAFWQQGEREVGDVEVQRIRRGAGVKVQRLGWQARAELVQASGAIESGPTFPGQPVAVSEDGRAAGGTFYLQYGRGMASGAVRYDELWRGYEAPASLRVFRTLTLDAQITIAKRFRLMADYELRWLAAPDADADTQAVAGTMGDRLSVQAVVNF